jgi:hypothetical protein
LKSLTQDDAALLCGREDVVRQIVDNCQVERFTVITSEPGLGVTSLLHAGLAPALRKEGFIVAVFSDWQGRFFVANLKEAVANAVREQADPLFFAQGEALDYLLKTIGARTGRPIALLLDQFEDYVRCHQNSPVAEAFDAELAHAVATRKGVVVVGMQDHAICEFERLGQVIPNLLGFRVVLQPLSAADARKAVISEARSIDLEVEPEALTALTTASMVLYPAAATPGTEEPIIHPFYLKLASGILLDGEARVKSTHVRMATIEARGGVDAVVMSAFDAQIAELGSTQLDLLFRWCNILISADKHRLAVTEKGLTEYAGRLNRFVPRLLEHLTGVGMLRPVEAGETIRYEISRECYVPILRDWWERHESAIAARRRAIFRITSISVAVSAIVLAYVVWLIFGKQR